MTISIRAGRDDPARYTCGLRASAAICLALLLSGCAAGAGALAARGAVGALAARGAAGAVARGAMVRAGTSRLLVSDPLVGMAARRGVIREALHRVTAGGTRLAELSIERDGLIRAGVGAEPLARLEMAGGRIFANGRVEGVLENGVIYEFVGTNERVAAAALRGFIPSRGVRVAGPNGSQMQILQRNIVVDVLEVNNGFYLIRLPGNRTQWVGAELVALALVAADGSANDCLDAPGVMVRTSGLAVSFDRCFRADGALWLDTSQGTIIVDAFDVASIMPGKLAGAAAEGAVRLSGGHALYGTVEQSDDAVRIVDQRGGVTVADVQRVGA